MRAPRLSVYRELKWRWTAGTMLVGVGLSILGRAFEDALTYAPGDPPPPPPEVEPEPPDPDPPAREATTEDYREFYERTMPVAETASV